MCTNDIVYIKFREYRLNGSKVEMEYAQNNTHMDTENIIIS